MKWLAIVTFVFTVRFLFSEPGHCTEKDNDSVIIDRAAKLWSFQPLGNLNAAKVADSKWPAGEIDRFILARLEAEKIRPAKEASRSVLMRRLYVDLLGLPPSPEEQSAFLESDDPQAWRKLVDRVLASPHFGERWGRHWLDIARYADSTGGGNSSVLPDAWKYRDYVIESFNDDKPYDRFVREQIAGDLLPFKNVEERAGNLAATGFLVLGARSYITDDPEIFAMDGIDEQITTVVHSIMAMTLECTRCHDHKTEPISEADYYSLGGIFGSTETADPVPGSKNYTWNLVADPREDPDGLRLAIFEAKSRAIGDLRVKIRDLKGKDDVGSKRQLAELEVEVIELKKKMPKKPATFMGVSCIPEPHDMRIRIRGDPHNAGDPVRRGFVEKVSLVMNEGTNYPDIPPNQSGRLDLAKWLSSPKNPLPARVMVNRVWYHLFGRGIVTTVDNFGTTGEEPTHPELLDWLARQFVKDGWSVKTLIKRMVMSRTYRMALLAENGESGFEIDPGNLLFGRKQRRSLDAEALRDAVLSVSGELELSGGGSSFPATLRQEFNHKFISKRRSVYVPRFRNNSLELFQVFDTANTALNVGRRDRTILPTQALFLINNDFLIEQSEQSAKRLLANNELSNQQRIELMYQRTFCRPPTIVETTMSLDFVKEKPESVELWSALQQTLFECIDFRFVK